MQAIIQSEDKFLALNNKYDGSERMWGSDFVNLRNTVEVALNKADKTYSFEANSKDLPRNTKEIYPK